MNLLFSIDRGFIPLLLGCMKTVVQNGGYGHYDAYLLHSDFGKAEQIAIQDGAGPAVDCHFVPVPDTLFHGFPQSPRYPKQIYYRLAAPLLLPKKLERVLYLDVDTVVINPLDSLYEMDFEGNCYVACTHTWDMLTRFNQARLGTEKDVPYINTGVMLLNLPALRKEIDMGEIRDYANAKKHRFILPDQDILTALYGERVKLADTMRYNLSDRMLKIHNTFHPSDKRDLGWVRQNGVIIHYYGTNKPWKDHYSGILDVFYQELVGQSGADCRSPC